MGLWTIIIGDGSGTQVGYKVRAGDAWLARAQALQVFKGHHGLGGQVDFIIDGEVTFHPNYEGHQTIVVIDLGTAQFGEGA